MELYDYEQVASKMNALNDVFINFATTLENIDAKLNENVNIGDESAMHGEAAKSLLSSWNECSETFVNFKNEFNTLYSTVGAVSQNNANLEDETVALFSSMNSETTPSSTSTATPTSTPATTATHVSAGSGGASGGLIGGGNVRSTFTTTMMR